MSQAAAGLLRDDPIVDETELLNDELDTERELRRKGKQRQYDEDADDSDPEEQDGDKNGKDSSLLTVPRPRGPARLESFDYATSDTKVIKKHKRRKYWQRAAVNVLFILSWYFFSSLISVYSEFKYRLAFKK